MKMDKSKFCVMLVVLLAARLINNPKTVFQMVTLQDWGLCHYRKCSSASQIIFSQIWGPSWCDLHLLVSVASLHGKLHNVKIYTKASLFVTRNHPWDQFLNAPDPRAKLKYY